MDIVEELENAAWSLPSQPDGYTNSHPGPINVCTHAAAEIKRLRTAEAHALSVVRAQQETVERLRAELVHARDRAANYGMVDLPQDINAALREGGTNGAA